MIKSTAPFQVLRFFSEDISEFNNKSLIIYFVIDYYSESLIEIGVSKKENSEAFIHHITVLINKLNLNKLDYQYVLEIDNHIRNKEQIESLIKPNGILKINDSLDNQISTRILDIIINYLKYKYGHQI